MRIIAEMAEALDVAHTARRRPSRPQAGEHLSLQRGPREDFVKVLDFGVSKLIDSATLTQEKAMVGTPLVHVARAGDRHAGADAGERHLLARRDRVGDAHRAARVRGVVDPVDPVPDRARPTPKLAGKAPGLSAQADEVFARVLCKKSDDRYKRATQFAEDLRIALGREEPGDLAPRTIAFDGDGLEALALAPESPSDIIRASAMVDGADETELDSSTKAEEALASPLAPSPRAATPSGRALAGDQGGQGVGGAHSVGAGGARRRPTIPRSRARTPIS